MNIPANPSEHNTEDGPARPGPWMLAPLSYLCLLAQAQESRIRRLEEINRQFAVELDRRDRRGGLSLVDGEGRRAA